MYIPIAGFVTALTQGLAATGVHLPIPEKDYTRLLELLADGYTYVYLQDGRALEVAKLEAVCGKLVLTRGQEGTKAKSFPCGGAVYFALTTKSVQAMVCQMTDCKGADMTYVGVTGFMSTLVGKLADIDTDLPIHDEHKALLIKAIPDSSYTVLRLFDNSQIEYVKVVNNGGSLRIERGQETTTAKTFPVGTCVKWELTPSAIRDIVCQMPCCE